MRLFNCLAILLSRWWFFYSFFLWNSYSWKDEEKIWLKVWSSMELSYLVLGTFLILLQQVACSSKRFLFIGIFWSVIGFLWKIWNSYWISVFDEGLNIIHLQALQTPKTFIRRVINFLCSLNVYLFSWLIL